VIVRPDTSLRIARTDPVRIKAESTVVPDKAVVTLSDGSATEVACECGEMSMPATTAPELATIEWRSGDAPLFETRVEVVSHHYFALDDLTASDGTDDFSGFTDEQLWQARQAATETFEENAHRAFVRRRGSTETHSGGFVWLDHNDVREMLTPGWELLSDCTAVGPDGHATIEYVWGIDDVPARVSSAVMQLAAYFLRPSVTPERATGEATEAGFIRYTLAGRDGATGLPEVDAAIEQFGRQRVVVL